MKRLDILELIDRYITELINRYNATPRRVVSTNIKRLTVYNPPTRQQPQCQIEAKVLAEQLGVSTQTIYGWYKEKGNKPPFDTAYKLAYILGVDMEELIRPVDELLEEVNLPPCKVCGEKPANAAMSMCWRCYQAERRTKKKKGAKFE